MGRRFSGRVREAGSWKDPERRALQGGHGRATVPPMVCMCKSGCEGVSACVREHVRMCIVCECESVKMCMCAREYESMCDNVYESMSV